MKDRTENTGKINHKTRTHEIYKLPYLALRYHDA